MDQNYSAQDIVRCYLCDTPVPEHYCDTCYTSLCTVCAEEHLSDKFKDHKVVPFRQRRSSPNYPKCPKHTKKRCELHCEQCDVPICTRCLSTRKHKEHKIIDIVANFQRKKEIIQTELLELEKSIYPKYQETASTIPVRKADLHEHSKKFTTDLIQRGEDLHREVDAIIEKLKSESDENEANCLAFLNDQEKEINRGVSEIARRILDLKKLSKSNDVCLVAGYTSQIAELSKPPPNLNVSIPHFSCQEINTAQLSELFGSLSLLPMTVDEPDNNTASQGAESSPPSRLFLDQPEFIRAINTRFELLYSVTCLSDDKIWTRGNNNIMKLHNHKKELLESIKTKSENKPWDLAVTKTGDLLYTDPWDSSVNRVTNKEIQPLIRFRGWIPRNLCSTSSGDLLVVVNSDDNEETKVVRFSGSTKIQNIQFNDKGQALFAPQSYTKYICENRNMDICVADYLGRAVVVVNQAGRHRFTYTGSSFPSTESFIPVGIATDSQSRILAADCMNHRIHVIENDGRFLRYIDNCDLFIPLGLCVDTKDNLLVAERDSGKVKIIQYYI